MRSPSPVGSHSPSVAPVPPRRVLLQSQPVLTSFHEERQAAIDRANAPLAAFAGVVSGRAGCSSVPEVQSFFDQRMHSGQAMAAVDNAALPPLAPRQQRLRGARSTRLRPEWGVHDIYDYALARTRADALLDAGLPLRRDRLRDTPSSRLVHIVRPGYEEMGNAANARAVAREADAESALASARSRRAEMQRRRHRRTHDEHQLQAMRLPVPLERAAAVERQARERAAEAYRRDNERGRAAVARELAAFDRARGTVHTRGSDGGGDLEPG